MKRILFVLLTAFFMLSCQEDLTYVSFTYENPSLSQIDMEVIFMEFIMDHGYDSFPHSDSIDFTYRDCEFTAEFSDGETFVHGMVTDSVDIDALERSYLQSLLF